MNRLPVQAASTTTAQRLASLAFAGLLVLTLLPGFVPDAKATGSSPSESPSFGADGLAAWTVTSKPGTSAGEPSIGLSHKDGLVHDALYQSGIDTYRVHWDAAGAATWTDVTDPIVGTVTATSVLMDPILFTEHESGRTFAGNLQDAVCGMFSYTDDLGESWTQVAGSCALPAYDHETIAYGPWHDPKPAQAVLSDKAAYYCAQEAEDICWTSYDGGKTFTPLSLASPFLDCGGTFGHVKIGPDGTIYIPSGTCYNPGPLPFTEDGSGLHTGFMFSEDNGATWDSSVITALPSGTGPFDPSLDVTPSGWVYMGQAEGAAAGGPYIAITKDNGATWEQVGGGSSTYYNVATAWNAAHPANEDINAAEFAEVVVGDDERAAFAFLGSSGTGDKGADCVASSHVWYLYVAMTYDAGRTWEVSKADPSPVQHGKIANGGTLSGACRNLLDFNGIDLDAEGRVYVAYADGCVNCAGPATTEVATIARQLTGKGLYSEFDTGGSTGGVPGITITTPTSGQAVTPDTTFTMSGEVDRDGGSGTGGLSVDAGGPYSGAVDADIPIAATVTGGSAPSCAWTGTGATFGNAAACSTTVRYASATGSPFTVTVTASETGLDDATDTATVTIGAGAGMRIGTDPTGDRQADCGTAAPTGCDLADAAGADGGLDLVAAYVSEVGDAIRFTVEVDDGDQFFVDPVGDPAGTGHMNTYVLSVPFELVSPTFGLVSGTANIERATHQGGLVGSLSQVTGVLSRTTADAGPASRDGDRFSVDIPKSSITGFDQVGSLSSLDAASSITVENGNVDSIVTYDASLQSIENPAWTPSGNGGSDGGDPTACATFWGTTVGSDEERQAAEDCDSFLQSTTGTGEDCGLYAEDGDASDPISCTPAGSADLAAPLPGVGLGSAALPRPVAPLDLVGLSAHAPGGPGAGGAGPGVFFFGSSYAREGSDFVDCGQQYVYGTSATLPTAGKAYTNLAFGGLSCSITFRGTTDGSVPAGSAVTVGLGWACDSTAPMMVSTQFTSRFVIDLLEGETVKGSARISAADPADVVCDTDVHHDEVTITTTEAFAAGATFDLQITPFVVTGDPEKTAMPNFHYKVGGSDASFIEFPAGNAPLVAEAGGPYTGAASTAIDIAATSTGGSGTPTCAWSGPASASFAAANACSTTVSFAADGTYQIAVAMTSGSETANDQATVTVGTPPAGERVEIYDGATLLATATGLDTLGSTEPAPWSTPVTLTGAGGARTLTAKWFDAQDALLDDATVTVDVEGTGPCDGVTTGPTLSDLAWSATATSATLAWSTDRAATSEAEYGADATYGLQASGASDTTSHEVTLDGLTPATTYHYMVTSGACGFDSSSIDNTFTTASVGDPEVAITDPQEGDTVTGATTFAGTFDTEGASGTTSGSGLVSDASGSPAWAGAMQQVLDSWFWGFATERLHGLPGFEAVIPDFTTQSAHVVLSQTPSLALPTSVYGLPVTYEVAQPRILVAPAPQGGTHLTVAEALAHWQQTRAEPSGPAAPGLQSGIGPGSAMLQGVGGVQYLCSTSYLFVDPADPSQYYLSTAGHCMLRNKGDIDKTGADDPLAVNNFYSICFESCIDNALQMGTYVDITIADFPAGQHPALYASASPSATDDSQGIGRDFGLLRIPKALNPMLRPWLTQWGGPDGMESASLGDLVVHYGHGTYCCPSPVGGYASRTPADQGRVAVALGSYSDGSFENVGWLSGGDSGSASGLGAADAGKGIRGVSALGVNTHGIITEVGIFDGTLLSKGLAMVQAKLHFTPRLVLADEAIQSGGAGPTTGPAFTSPGAGASVPTGTTVAIAGTASFATSGGHSGGLGTDLTTYYLHRMGCGSADPDNSVFMDTIRGEPEDASNGGNGCGSLADPVGPAAAFVGLQTRNEYAATPPPAQQLRFDLDRKVHVAINADTYLGEPRLVGDFAGELSVGSTVVATGGMTQTLGGTHIGFDLDWTPAAAAAPAGSQLVFTFTVKQAVSGAYIYSGGADGSFITIPTVPGSVADTVQVSLDDADFAPASLLPVTGSATWSSSWDTTGAALGQHTLYARTLQDGVPVGTRASRSITVGEDLRPGVQVRLAGPASAGFGWTRAATQDASAGTWSHPWAPGDAPAGAYVLEARLLDDGGSVIATTTRGFTFAIGNTPPTLAPIGNQAGTEGTLLTFTLDASDPDGDDLTFSSLDLPAGASLGTTDGVFSWTPGFADDGAHTVTFQVSDGQASASQTASFTISDTNRPPAFTDPGARAAKVGATTTLVLTASDPDGGVLTYARTAGPTGSSFDPATATFTWTPTSADEGLASATFTVTDGYGQDSTTVSLMVTKFVNDAVDANVAFLAPRFEWAASGAAVDTALQGAAPGTKVWDEAGNGAPLFSWAPGNGRVAFEQNTGTTAGHGIVTITPSMPRHIREVQLQSTKCEQAKLTLFLLVQPTATVDPAAQTTVAYDIPTDVCDADRTLETWTQVLPADVRSMYVADYVLAATATAGSDGWFQYGNLVAYEV